MRIVPSKRSIHDLQSLRAARVHLSKPPSTLPFSFSFISEHQASASHAVFTMSKDAQLSEADGRSAAEARDAHTAHLDVAGALGAHLPPLNERDDHLDPSQEFSPDIFLLSRAPGQTLSRISSELHSFESQLREQLESVVDRDFRKFVDLGTSLKAEAPRIARLAWHKENADDAVGPVAGTLGLNSVRGRVEEVRDDLRAAERQLEDVVLQRHLAAQSKAQLTLLLNFEECLQRLEQLLGLTSHHHHQHHRHHDHHHKESYRAAAASPLHPAQARPSLRSPTDVGPFRAHNPARWIALDGGSDSDEHGTISADEDFYHSPDTDDEPQSDEGAIEHQSPYSSPPMAKRRISSAHKARRRSSGLTRRSSAGADAALSSGVEESSASTTADLPARVARASAEYSALLFHKREALTLGLSRFIDAHCQRTACVEERLRVDLEMLIELLTRYDGGSLLLHYGARVGRSQQAEKDAAELERFTHVTKMAEPDSQYWSLRKQEQQRWLQLAVSTWQLLPENEWKDSAPHQRQDNSSDPSALDGVRGVAEVIRECLVRPWAENVINSNSLSLSNLEVSNLRTPVTPAGFDGKQGSAAVRSEEASSKPLLQPEAISEATVPLLVLYNQILAFAQTVAPIADVAERAPRHQAKASAPALSVPTVNLSLLNGAHHAAGANVPKHLGPCNVFAKSLWVEVGNRLMDELGGQLFFVGRPDVFHQNFTLTSEFLASLLMLAPSPQAANAVRDHPTYTTFKKRWQLSVYFQIRYREIVSKLEPKLAVAADTARTGNISITLPLMVSTEATVEAFVAPWAKHIRLNELAARQWRLSLQIVSRYKSWLYAELPEELHKHATSRPAPLSTHSRLNSGQEERPASPMRSVQPSRTGTPANVESEAATAADDAALRTLTIFAADTLWLQRELSDAFDTRIVPVIVSLSDGSSASELVKAMRHTLQEACSYQGQSVASLSQRIVSVLKTRCGEPLRLVRSMGTQYRGSSAPTSSPSSAQGLEPSYFVPQALRPLKMYLGKGERAGDTNSSLALARHLDTETRSSWAQKVVDDIVERYTSSLQAMNRNYESLRRLKRGNQSLGLGSIFGRSGVNNSDGVALASDPEAERMRAQMRADVEALRSEIGALQEVDTFVKLDGEAWDRLKAAADGSTEDA
ncbi:COG2-domain-containing protein [Ceraceosorus guamensis]|uniref:Conserved oligomeric Golgi complex subunit 2 n=1 Tax=Ceraceosorus guamensis TaxID=1522189 RepID=A0A316W212_9BASI|nr:COG2-domain-containing protein [Ceraceosorus guamensis]PWN43830.1 COG2-domain-containing protein [Ceraceosorus guamensis]